MAMDLSDAVGMLTAMDEGETEPATRRPGSWAEKHAWLWPAPTIVAVAGAGAAGGWIAAAATTAFVIALAGALLAKLVEWQAVALAAFVAATVVFAGLALRGTSVKESDPPGVLSLAALEQRTDLRRAMLAGRDLPGIDLHRRSLQGAEAAGAVLRGAKLDDSRLDGADLAGADLRGASLTGTCLSGTNLAGALLDGADFDRAVVDGVIGAGDHHGARNWGRSPARAACRAPSKP